MIENFLINPFLALILIAILSSLLGVFVLWKKLSYFGDALSHSMLLGLILGAATKTNQILAVIIFAIIFVFLARIIERDRYFSKDTIIMILSYFCISLSVIISDIWFKNFSFSSYIFGDVLAAENSDLIFLALLNLLVFFYVIFAFKRILLINLSRDLAKISGIKIDFWEMSFLIILSIAIALSVRIVGVFLMTALLILPAAIARIFSSSPKQMMILALVFSLLIASSAFKVATNFDLTVSSTIVAIFFVIFVLSLSAKNIYLKATS